jgi:flavin reductase (DIM6/NTAB) family NADH-FMN oxidoreductase RutF
MKESLGPRPLVYPTPVLVIGTYDADGAPNVMTAAWGGVCCSDPPSVAVAVRRQRHTFAALTERKAFTVSIPPERYIAEADFVGMVSGRRENKWEKTGLTPVRSDLVDAPYVGEFPLVLECTVSHAVDLGTHTLFIGRILDTKIDADCLKPDGSPDVAKIRPCLFAPATDTYYSFGEILGKAFSIGAAFK